MQTTSRQLGRGFVFGKFRDIVAFAVQFTRRDFSLDCVPGARRSQRHWRCVVVVLVLFAACAHASAASLRLTTVAHTNMVALGSGTDLGQPDGVFSYTPPNVVPDWQFSAPLAAVGGHFAFAAAVQQRDNRGNLAGIDTGIWGGVAGRGLAMIFRQRLPVPSGGGKFTRQGLFNVSDAGAVAFFAEGEKINGLWWGDASAAPVAPLELVQRVDFSARFSLPLQAGSYISYYDTGTNLTYNILTKQSKVVFYPGMTASVFGAGVTLNSSSVILALTDQGQLLMQGTASDGTNRIFLVNGPGDIIPILSQGQPAPGVANKRIGFMFASGNTRGAVAMLTRLDDGDANLFNDQSALFAGPPTNVSLVAQSTPGTIWGGGTFITRSNQVVGAGRGGGVGLYQLPDFPGGNVSFTPFPPLPYPALPGATGLGSSVNSLGQYVVLYGNAALNRGSDLWLFNPGDGWTNVARAGSNIVASGQTIVVNSLGFAGNLPFGSGTGGGIASGLSDDGTLMFSVNGAYIVSAQIACTQPGIELIALEVNQAVQDWNNSVLLVEGKQTYVRAFVQPENCPGNTAPVLVSGAQLRGFRNGVELPASPLAPINPGGALLARTNTVERRDQLYESLVFTLPPSWTSNAITLQFEWPGGAVTYSDPAEPGGTAADGIVKANFQPGSIPSVKWVGVAYKDQGTNIVQPHIADADELGRRLVSLYPINGHDLLYAEIMWPFVQPPGSFPDLARINLTLAKMRVMDLGITNVPIPGLSHATRYYGFCLGNLGGGLSDGIPGTVASGWMPLPAYAVGRERHAHELAHILGRHHAVDSGLGLDPLQQKRGYCREVATNTAPDFPNLHNVPVGRRPTLGPMDQGPNPMIWGIDAYSIFKNGPPFSQVVNPTNTFELMSYCRSANFPTRWNSSYTYTNLFDILGKQFPAPHSLLPPGGLAGARALQAVQNVAASDYLLISGEIDVFQNSAVLSAVQRVRLAAPPPPTPGGYTLRLRDAGGTTLADIPFTANLGEPDAPENGLNSTAIFVLPVLANPAIRQIEILRGGQLLASRQASANAPTVKVLSPNGGETLANDPVTIRWEANDADGDSLTYLVQFSGDGGQSWQTLTLDWPRTSYTVSLDALRATQQGRIRVQASDGFNTSEDESDANFIVPNQPPKIGLASSAQSELVVGAQQFVLRANATDREDGSVPDERVQWTSAIDGRLGNGNSLFLKANALSEGDHTITVTASDANGASVTNSFAVRVLRQANPQLEIQAVDGLIRITWPAALVDFGLESSPDLKPGNWTPETGAANIARGWRQLDLPATAAVKFFRLRKS